jgi:hypothetical protein
VPRSVTVYRTSPQATVPRPSTNAKAAIRNLVLSLCNSWPLNSDFQTPIKKDEFRRASARSHPRKSLLFAWRQHHPRSHRNTDRATAIQSPSLRGSRNGPQRKEKREPQPPAGEQPCLRSRSPDANFIAATFVAALHKPRTPRLNIVQKTRRSKRKFAAIFQPESRSPYPLAAHAFMAIAKRRFPEKKAFRGRTTEPDFLRTRRPQRRPGR